MQVKSLIKLEVPERQFSGQAGVQANASRPRRRKLCFNQSHALAKLVKEASQTSTFGQKNGSDLLHPRNIYLPCRSKPFTTCLGSAAGDKTDTPEHMDGKWKLLHAVLFAKAVEGIQEWKEDAI